MTIEGPGANLLTISGNNTQQVFDVTGGTTTLPVVLADLTIANGSGITGGGIENSGHLALSDCTISGNTAEAGGGIDNYHGTLYLYGCAVSGNAATTTGGGGILNYGQVSMGQCTVANNGSYYSGGGIDNVGGRLSLSGCTIAGNSDLGINSPGETVTIDNTIVAANLEGDLYGPTSGSNNFVGGNPMLAPLGYYGGPTQTMALLPGSPAIGKGKPVSGPVTDQRDFALDSPTPDIGAFQTQPGIVVNATVDGQGSPLGDLSLRDAINLAHAFGGSETITFASGLTGTIALTLGPLQAITGPTTIVGPGASTLTIDARHASRILSIGASENLTISGLTLANGSRQPGRGHRKPGDSGAHRLYPLGQLRHRRGRHRQHRHLDDDRLHVLEQQEHVGRRRPV